MALPLIAGIAIAAGAGAVGGGIFGSVFGGGIDSERERLEELVKNYRAQANALTEKYQNFNSYSDIINQSAIYGNTAGFNLDKTYLTDIEKSFRTPGVLDFRQEAA